MSDEKKGSEESSEKSTKDLKESKEESKESSKDESTKDSASESSADESKEKASETTEAQKEWDEQAGAVNRDGKPIDAEGKVIEEGKSKDDSETDSKTAALEKENERIAIKREKLMGEIKQGRKDNKELEAEKEEQGSEEKEEEKEEPTVGEQISQGIANETAKSNFYRDKVRSRFYTGEDGEKNKELVEAFVKANFKSSTNKARGMAHKEIFGEFEEDSSNRKAELDGRKQMLEADAASLGSTKGGTKTSTEPVRKRILKKPVPAKDWYPETK